MAAIRRHIGENVEPNWKLQITRVEVHEMVGAVRGNVVEDLFGKVAVGIDESDTMSEDDVLDDEVAE